MTKPQHSDNPGVRIPPPILVVSILVVSLLVDYFIRKSILQAGFGGMSGAVVYGGAGLVIAGILLGIWCAVVYHKAKTSILPHTADSTLIKHGPFRFSRNPIYLGMVLIYMGICLVRNAPIALMLVVLVILVLRIYVIAKEEAYLTRRFGDAYGQYCKQVRRWL